MKVRIGSSKLDLVLTKDDIIVNDILCNGSIQMDFGRLEIDKTMPIQCKKQTFWHEVVHGILDELGLGELCTDEGFVDSFGKMLYAFHEDNKLSKIYETLGG